MDSLTQIALGIATAELCAGKKLGRKTYMYGAILGTIPDLDVVTGWFMSPVAGVSIHRGLSHSIVFMMVISPVLGWLIAKLEQSKITFRGAAIMAFWCLFTHVLLDIFTSWGTQVFWPLPDRIALKTIFVIDPLYTVPLLICLSIAWRSRIYSIRRKYVLKGICISSFYLMLTCGIKLYALHQFRGALKQQHVAYEDIIVKPTALNSILWNANVAVGDGYLLGDYSIFDSQPITFKQYEKNTGMAAKLDGNPDFETLKKVSEGWYIITMYDNQYYFNDLRFGLLGSDPKAPQFAFSYVFENVDGQLKAKEVTKQKRDGKKLLNDILKRIKGN